MAVKDTDKGYREIVNSFTRLNQDVLVGIRAAEGSQTRDPGGPTIAEYAAWNEFGTETIDERSFLRSAVDENQEKYASRLAKACGKAVDAGDCDLERELSLLGELAVRDVQRKIVSGPFKKNAESTIAAKGSSKPLIDTGTMRGAVSYEVRSLTAK